MSDKIITATADDNAVSIVFCNMKDTCEEAISIHDLTGTAAETLCRALIGGVLLGSTLKNPNDLVTLIIRGEGPAGGLTVSSDINGHVKGYLYHPEAEGNSVSELLGPGVLTVTKDIGLREPYSGQLPLVTGEIAEDITAYFAESEQTPSSCGIGVRFNEDGSVAAAGGFLLQLLPDCPPSVIDKLEIDLMRHPSPTEMLLEYGSDYRKILDSMFPALKITVLDEQDVSWKCSCSRERIEKALISIGEDELDDIIREGEDTEVVCDFCRKKYNFTTDELKKLYAKAKT